jgi:hypothetical protein
MPWQFLDVRIIFFHYSTFLWREVRVPQTGLLCQRGIYPLGWIRGSSRSYNVILPVYRLV